MIIAKIIGTVISTRKNPALVGSKFMIAAPLKGMGSGRLVAVDSIGAGIGDLVLIATGSAARVGTEGSPVDAVIVGIVDDPGKISIPGGRAVDFGPVGE